jgi:hypothetical protein
MFRPDFAVKPGRLTITFGRLGNCPDPATFLDYPSRLDRIRVVPRASFPQNSQPSHHPKPIDKPDTYHD